MDANEIRFIGAALSPILILLFAFEMSSHELLYRKAAISEKAMTRRVAYSVFKLPLSMLLPLFLGVPGACMLAAATLHSIVMLIQRHRMLIQLWAKEWGEYGEDNTSKPSNSGQ